MAGAVAAGATATERVAENTEPNEAAEAVGEGAASTERKPSLTGDFGLSLAGLGGFIIAGNTEPNEAAEAAGAAPQD